MGDCDAHYTGREADQPEESGQIRSGVRAAPPTIPPTPLGDERAFRPGVRTGTPSRGPRPRPPRGFRGIASTSAGPTMGRAPGQQVPRTAPPARCAGGHDRGPFGRYPSPVEGRGGGSGGPVELLNP